MLLKVGTWMTALALASALVTAVVVSLRTEPVRTAAERVQPVGTTSETSPESQGAGEHAERAEATLPASPDKQNPSNGSSPSDSGSPSERKPDKGNPAERNPSEGNRPAPQSKSQTPGPTTGTSRPAARTSNGPRPTPEELAVANGPRRYPPRPNAALTLTVEKLKLYDMPVADSRSERALDRGVIHVPETPMPWDKREQKNVYLAAHRLGYPGTGSRLAFYHLDELEGGDEIVLKDHSGNAYRYRVTEVFETDPSGVWVMDTVRNRDIVTLQTYTPIPTFEKRLIVRADRI